MHLQNIIILQLKYTTNRGALCRQRPLANIIIYFVELMMLLFDRAGMINGRFQNCARGQLDTRKKTTVFVQIIIALVVASSLSATSVNHDDDES